MSEIYDPATRGFSEAFSTVDRAQVAMLREVAASGARMVLKGGLAMRVVVGSMRLTKDVDFDRLDGPSTASVKASLKRALTLGAQSARLLGPQIDDSKHSDHGTHAADWNRVSAASQIRGRGVRA